MEGFCLRKYKIGKIIILISLVLCIAGCADNSINDNTEQKKNINVELKTEEKKYIPVESKWQDGDNDYDPNDTIYHKTYYDDFVRGLTKKIKYPDVNLQEELEDYFIIDENAYDKTDKLVDMFFDDRTINMEEQDLKDLFYSHGYLLHLHHATIQDIQVRFVEIQEIGGLSFYPSRILIQTWDDEHVYMQDITGPIPRKIRSFLVIDDKEEPQLIVHSSGFSKEYISEEELSFWKYRGSYWILTPMELEIDTSHAHNMEDMYPDLDRDTLFEATYYRDGIAYRPSIQGDGLHPFTFRLGAMIEIEKNKSFRLTAIVETLGRTLNDIHCYIQYEIK